MVYFRVKYHLNSLIRRVSLCTPDRKALFACSSYFLLVACSTVLQRDGSSHLSALQGRASCSTNETTRYLSAEHLHVANWNLFKGQRSGWHREIEELNHASTLFVIQEAPHHDTLTSSLGDKHAWRFSPGYHNGTVQTGVLTAAGAAPNLSCRLQHIEPWLGTAKASLITRYRLKGSSKELLVANIHSINFTFGTRAFSRQLDDLVELLSKHSGPMILAGDFNTWNIRRLEILESRVSALKLQAVEFDSTKVKRFFGYPLDHIFYRGLHLKNKRVKPTEFSDHNLLVASFQLPRE